jgi:Methyltransferase domain.
LERGLTTHHRLWTSHDDEFSSCPEHDEIEDEADSQFGTKQYWDDMYVGMGDFDSEEYCWYYGFDAIQPYFVDFIPLPPKQKSASSSASSCSCPKMLVPGVGNDGTLLDLYKFGYHDIVAFDYSAPAIDRQRELLSFHKNAEKDITLVVRDARKLDEEWTEMFDVIFEKGALDAIFLSGSGTVQLQLAVKELERVLKPEGYIMSISGVVPEDVRRRLFPERDWEWIRDGATDLKAGCFVWKKKMKKT